MFTQLAWIETRTDFHMPVSGLVVTLVKDGAAHRAALSALRAHPCITVHESFTADLIGELPNAQLGGLQEQDSVQPSDQPSMQSARGPSDGNHPGPLRVPIVVDARDAAEEEAVWQWLQDLDGAVFTDLVCSLGDEMAAPLHENQT